MLKEAFVAVISAVISGIVLTFAGYLLIIKENQVIIQSLKEQVADLKKDALRTFEIEIDNFREIKEKMEKTDTSLNATKLFIASVHPDNKNISMLSSLKKLNNLSIPELEQLAEGIKHKEVLKKASAWPSKHVGVTRGNLYTTY